MNYLDWKVGDRVQCVEGASSFVKPLEVGHVYTLRAILKHPETDDIGVYLVGIENGVHPKHAMEFGYLARRFRKVQPRKTSIARFEAILHGARVPEDA